MSGAKFTLLYTGLWDVPRNEIIAAETPEIYKENRRYTIPGFSVLVKDEKVGNVLWDTGITADWKKTWPKQFLNDYSFHQLEKLDEKLREIQLAPKDIDLLILSHLHYDHAGNIKLFRNTKAGFAIIISEAEAHEAFVKVSMNPDGVSGAYFRHEIIMDGIGYKTINRDTWITDNIFLFIQKGHTPGVIGMMVRTEKNGNFIFASDAVYSPYNFGPPVVLPGLCIDPEAYKANVERLDKMKEKYNAKIIFGHDVEDLKKWKLSPYFYE